MQEVVVIGGGFAGLRVARGLAASPVRVTLIDRSNHHCFQPLLYQVATGSLSPGQISAPLRWALRKQANVQVVLAEVYDFDITKQYVFGTALDGSRVKLPYDHLVVAAGARHSYFGNDQWEQHAPGLKTAADALELRHRIFTAFERADLAKDREERRRLLTFVVIGAGPTGVELAGQIVEIARRTLRREYRTFDPADTRTVLLDAAPIVLPGFDPNLSGRARKQLEDMGVEVRLDQLVTNIDEFGVTAGDSTYEAGTVVWAAGVQGSPLGATLAKQLGIEPERGGRIPVGEDFTVGGHDEIRIIGDLAAAGLPGVAPVAMQQGVWIAKSIDAFERRVAPPKPFRYINRGSMATIGRRRAVAHIGGLRMSGTIAWLAWLFVHLMYIVGFANRVLVLVRWTSAFFAGGRGERIITELEQHPTVGEVEITDAPVVD